MSKMLEIKVNELGETNVNWIALVNKGANRIPFRITKSDGEPTMDLYALGKRVFKSLAPPKPAVVAAIVAKTADIEAVKDVLTKSGISVDHQSEKDGMIVFEQPGVSATEDDTAVMKMSDDLVLVVSGVKKMFEAYNFESMDFNTVLAQEGFFPSMSLAMDMLLNTVGNIMENSDSAAVAKSAIDKAMSDFSMYVSGWASVLPERAFKADTAVMKMDGMDKGKKKKKPDECASDEKDMKKADEPESEAKKEEISANPTIGNETGGMEDVAGKKRNDIEGGAVNGNATPAASGGKAAPPASANNDIEGSPAVMKTEGGEGGDKPDPLAFLAETVTSLSALLNTVNEGQLALKAELSTLATSIGGVESRLAKTEEAVNGTALAETGDTDTTRTVKSEGRSAPPLLDTAYMAA